MRILMAGDTHGSLSHCSYLIKQAVANDCDRIFVLGDFGFWEHQPEGVLFLDELNDEAEKHSIVVYFLDGNHDKTLLLLTKYGEQEDEQGFLRVRSSIRYAGRGHRWTWDSIRFISLGGAYSVDKDWRLKQEASTPNLKSGDLWFPEEEMSDEDMALILENTEPVHVMLAHDKPRGSHPGWNRKDFVECMPNQDRLQKAVRALQPVQFWHGHLHRWYQQDMDYSDLEGTRRYVRVHGLNCDHEAGESYPYAPYRQDQSWAVLDLDQVLLQLVLDGRDDF